MFDQIKVWFMSHGFMVSVASVAISINLVLSGFQVLLEKLDQALLGLEKKDQPGLVDRTEVKVSGLLGIIGKVSSALQKAVDWMQGNREH